MPVPQNGRRKIFVSYSHKDRKWLERLQVHLKPLERDGLVEFWDDTRIRTGDEWRREINEALNSAAVAVLLISADFIASDFIAAEELPPLLAAAQKEGVKILPLILSPSRFEKIESLSRYQSINPPSEPLIKLRKGEQEEYLVKLSDDILHAMEESLKESVYASGEGQPRVFSVPFVRNRYFVGREEILDRLFTNFNYGGETVQALSGLGGIGKTQTALEYAYRHRADYSVVVWAKAHSRETLVIDFAAIAKLLGLPERDAEDQNLIVGSVMRWLSNNEGWLLILDNADNIAMVREFIPSSETGHVLLTTRAQNTRPTALCNVLDKMEPFEGVTFLLTRLKENWTLVSASKGELGQAETLSKVMGGLPLALDQAAAFIEEIPSTIEEYLQLYNSERAKLLAHRGELAEHHPDSVTVTFLLAFKRVAEINPAAADLLRFCAFLDADAIPEEVFTEGGVWSELWNSVTTGSLDFTETIKEAGRYSLIRRNTKASTLTIHRLVQAVLKDEMGYEEQCLWSGRAIRALNQLFAGGEYINHQLCDRLIPHIEALYQADYNWRDDIQRELAQLLDKAALYLAERTQHNAAEQLSTRALAIVLGSNHPALNSGSSALSQSLGAQLQQHAATMSIRGVTQPYDKKETGCLRSIKYIKDLALYFLHNADWQQAEPLVNQIITAYERLLGAEHSIVTQTIDEIVSAYLKGGNHNLPASILNKRVALAESFHPVTEELLSPERLKMSHNLYDLAWDRYIRGEYAEAESLHRRALAIREDELGPEHIRVSDSLYGLALSCHKQGE